MLITLKLTKPDGRIAQYTTHNKINRFYYIARHDKFLKAKIKVSYGKKECSQGCICEFSNEAEVFTKSDLLETIRAFMKEV